MKKRVLKSLLRICIGILFALLAGWFYIAQPSFSSNERSVAQVDSARLREHVKKLSVDFHPRNYGELKNLNATADYIRGHFAAAGAEVEMQRYTIGKREYVNVIAHFASRADAKKVIVGAHYDSYDDTPGADDNASGVAGLIELAYLIGKQPRKVAVDLVAYTLEEPPYFKSDEMGSRVHARSIIAEMESLVGVIVLEMIGYFSDEWGTQNYPVPLLHLWYPNRGNFMAVVGSLQQRSFTKKVKLLMKGATDLPIYSINAPSALPGVDFSDHASYWPEEINAVMVTNTAFFRNKEYHRADDTLNRLDYKRMGDVVVAVAAVLDGFE